MFTVLIADDERYIRVLVKNLINWEELGLSLVGEASNGVEALALISEKKPDIVITDIQMPLLDGLGLIKSVQETTNPQPKFIIISGHQEFRYAYEAIKYGAVDFLLKPIIQEEINATLKRIINVKQQTLANKLDTRIDEAELVRRQFPSSVFHGTKEVLELTLEEINTKCNFAFKQEKFRICLIFTDKVEQLGEMRRQIQKETGKLAVEFLKKVCHDVAYYATVSRQMLILNYAPSKEAELKPAIDKVLEMSRKSTRDYQFVSTTIGVGNIHKIENIDEGLREAERCIQSRAIVGTNRVIRYDEFENANSEDFPTVEGYLSEISQAQSLLDVDEIKVICKKCFKSVLEANKKTPYKILPMMYRKVQSIIMGAANIQLPQQSHEYIERLEKITFDDCGSLEEILIRAQQVIGEAYEEIRNNKSLQESKTIATIKNYIKNNLHRHVNLEEVSKEVFLSPAYLGVVFKKETGELISQYVNRIKMEKAKELLQDIEFTIREVAVQLGYKDMRYFSRQFRNYVGIKPSEYRKLYGSK